MGQVRGNGAANAARLGDRRAFTAIHASGCRELQRELTVVQMIEVLDPAGFLGLLAFEAFSCRGVTKRNLRLVVSVPRRVAAPLS